MTATATGHRQGQQQHQGMLTCSPQSKPCANAVDEPEISCGCCLQQQRVTGYCGSTRAILSHDIASQHSAAADAKDTAAQPSLAKSSLQRQGAGGLTIGIKLLGMYSSRLGTWPL